MNAAGSELSHRARRSVRLVRKGGGPALPFVPYGLLPLLALVFVFLFAAIPFARGGVQDVAERAAHEALEGIGADWAQVSASGQWVTLAGSPPTVVEGEAALIAVRMATAPTLFGRARPVTRVTASYSGAVANAPGEAPNVTPAMEGPVGDPTDEEIVVCETSLAALLAASNIGFATGSAEIDAASASLLDDVAAAVLSCPGVLRIEGHTDDIGSDDVNRGLSQERADAVRSALIERGLAADRLVAEGYGATRPVADNDSADGRQRNRRIEMRVMRPPN